MSTSVTVYASRSISWDTVTLPSGATFQGGVLFPDTVLEERHDDDSIISENPVEIGSVVNDNAFDTPQELELLYAWSLSSQQANGQPDYLETTYQRVLDLKQAKILLNVVTGKREYQNLLIKGISEITDRDNENSMTLRLTLRQMLLTYTQTVTITSAAQQSMPQKTAPTLNGGTVSLQPGNNYNAGTAGQ